MSNLPLFRQEALASERERRFGGILLIRPLPFSLLTALAAAAAVALILFASFFTYTRHSAVAGRLVPDAGLIKIYSPQSGVIVKRVGVEGQEVKRGDTLFVLSGERHSAAQIDVQAAISNQVQLRQGSLRGEREKARAVQLDERNALQTKIAGMQAQLAKVDSEIAGQQSRVKLAEETVARYNGLLKQDYVTREQAQQKDEDLLDQRNRLESLERDRIALDGQIKGEQANLASLDFKQQNQLAQLDRDLASASQELTESEARRELIVTAPESGVVTAITVEPGQNVDTSHPLASIVPTGAKMQAYLYASSKAIGFIKPGDQVYLRYQAYPYQKFGHARGTVATVSRTALSASELDANLGGNNSEPMYRVVVDLASQSVTAYGKPQPLQAGMLLDADILQDKRRLYEWVLEPLYSLTGKL